jgi:para-nitrobenzyl esterase
MPQPATISVGRIQNKVIRHSGVDDAGAVLADFAKRSVQQHQVTQARSGEDRRRVAKRLFGNGISASLGIPFAAPSVGELRWKRPAPPAKWTGERDAGAFDPVCVQTSTFGVLAVRSTTEDCLYLNVCAPTSGRGELRPVMVWLHGGGLLNGQHQRL